MERRKFVHIGCACLVTPWVAVLTGCEATRYVTGTLEGNGISVPRSEFVVTSKTGTTQRDYVIVRHDRLEFPICLYRFSDNEYSALLMKCTHQGTELRAAGDQLHCPAHGSEFNSKGQVTLGPATDPLRTFRVISQQENLVIELK